MKDESTNRRGGIVLSSSQLDGAVKSRKSGWKSRFAVFAPLDIKNPAICKGHISVSCLLTAGQIFVAGILLLEHAAWDAAS